MGGINRNNMEDYIPQEIPIPDVKETKGVQRQKDISYERQGQYALNEEQSQNTSYIEHNQSNPYREQNQNGPYGQWNRSNSYGQPIQPYNLQGKQKRNESRIILIAACFFALILVIGIGVTAYISSTPAYKISKGFRNLGKEIRRIENPLADKIGMNDILVMMQEESSHVETKLNFSTDIPMLSRVTLGVDTDFYKDVNAKELVANTAISMMNYEFANVNIYANEDKFCFSIPELFLENMYIDNENVVSQFNQSILAEWTQPVDTEDFSIQLFSDKDKKISVRDWRNLTAASEESVRNLNACKEAMSIEKVEKGLYRVTLPQKETNRLLQGWMDEYSQQLENADSSKERNADDTLLESDVSFLIEISGRNRIDSIVLETPVKVMNGEIAVSGEIFFMGEKRSIDKIQCKLVIEDDHSESMEVLGQIVQTITADNYGMEMDVKYTVADVSSRMKYVVDCDAVDDTFELDVSMKGVNEDLEIALEGAVYDFVKGESLDFALQKLAFSSDGNDIFRITGYIEVEPLRDEIKPSVNPETAFFKMNEYDWERIMDRIDDEYGSLLKDLW